LTVITGMIPTANGILRTMYIVLDIVISNACENSAMKKIVYVQGIYDAFVRQCCRVANVASGTRYSVASTSRVWRSGGSRGQSPIRPWTHPIVQQLLTTKTQIFTIKNVYTVVNY